RGLGAGGHGRETRRGKDEPGRAVGRPGLYADRERGKAWRAVLPGDGLRVAEEPAQCHLEQQMGNERGAGLIDPCPELRQVVAQAEAAEWGADGRRCEAVEQPPLVDGQGPAYEIGDATVCIA